MQPAVFAGRAVNEDQGVVEQRFFTRDGDREVVFIDLPPTAVGPRVVPVAVVQVDQFYFVFLRIERLGDLCGALEGDFPLGGVPACQQGDMQRFHADQGL